MENKNQCHNSLCHNGLITNGGEAVMCEMCKGTGYVEKGCPFDEEAFNPDQPKNAFKENDKVIIYDGIKYEIGLFKMPVFMSNNSLVEFRSGKYIGHDYIKNIHLFPYSDEKIDELTKKHGYEKRFSTEF